jgi:hypothetical protein
MREHDPEELEGLDEAIAERLRDGTATKLDEIAKLEHLRQAAMDHGDAARVQELDVQLSTLRIGE